MTTGVSWFDQQQPFERVEDKALNAVALWLDSAGYPDAAAAVAAEVHHRAHEWFETLQRQPQRTRYLYYRRPGRGSKWAKHRPACPECGGGAAELKQSGWSMGLRAGMKCEQLTARCANGHLYQFEAYSKPDKQARSEDKMVRGLNRAVAKVFR